MLLRHLLDQGLSKAAVARQLGVSRRTVYHWLTTGQLTGDLATAAPRRRAGRPLKLAPYTPILQQRLGRSSGSWRPAASWCPGRGCSGATLERPGY